MIRCPPTSPLFPYTTLFRSHHFLLAGEVKVERALGHADLAGQVVHGHPGVAEADRSEGTRLNSSHLVISYAVFCLKKKNAVHQPDEYFYILCNQCIRCEWV